MTMRLASALAISMCLSSAASAAIVGYTSQAAFAAAVGATTTDTFGAFADGAAVISLPGVTSVTCDSPSGGGSCATTANSSTTLAFQMFTAGTLPSETMFLSSGMAGAQGFSTAAISFTFAGSTTAVGAFVADGSPLGGFVIELFDAADLFIGSFVAPPRNLSTGSGFIGLTSDVAFTRARFDSNNAFDSFGLDNLEFGAAAVPAPGALSLLGLGILGVAGFRRKA